MKYIVNAIRYVATRPYPNKAARALAILAMDLALFAVFYGVVAAFAAALHVLRPLALLGACLLLWLAMDAAACWASRRRG